jgi:hypothetical protein
MELTRRDALAALAGAGILAGGTSAVLERNAPDSEDESPHRALDALIATAHVVYPSEVSNVREFVETYARTKLRERPAYRDGVETALDDLNEDARYWYGDRYLDLDADDREALLEDIGVDVVEPDPDANTAGRVRYYLVNELFYALYTSPTGGRLVGIENPQGHPGGTRSYQQPPSDESN